MREVAVTQGEHGGAPASASPAIARPVVGMEADLGATLIRMARLAASVHMVEVARPGALTGDSVRFGERA